MIICDGNNFMWRSHYSAAHLSSRGRLSGALHVGLKMLLAFPALFNPAPIVFAWDSPSWRKAEYPGYKAQRKKDKAMRDAVHAQMAVFEKILRTLGIAQVRIPRLEADDIAGMIITRLMKFSRRATLISSDKDWFQLLGKGITLVRGWDDKNKDIWTAERLRKEFGVPPNKWQNYLALAGDSSDNIPRAKFRMRTKTILAVLRGEEELDKAAQDQYDFNLRITRIMREPSEIGMQDIRVLAPKQTLGSRAALEHILNDYELYDVRTNIDKLMEIGSWR